MKHTTITLAALWALMMPSAGSAFSAENCRITTEIVSTAIHWRSSGLSAKAVKQNLREGEYAVTGPYVATIGPLVDMVFSLDEDALTQKTAQQYKTQCLNF